ncbi:MAG: hypothetical protein OEV60_06295 [Actinomycetota bacterium]|nr:hypothetical protein [Actinomycetota bacterium]MDH5224338.1 hypothetical protein [Actinomycetota bacterium]MDH5312499.1 hypothetical protein [Actinomycetota bacterium]
MYRNRQYLTVSGVDAWNSLVALTDDINKLCAERGWTQGTLLTRTFGTFNELCFEFDYPDLATYERELREWMADPETGALMQRLDSIEREGNGYDELWMEAEPVTI